MLKFNIISKLQVLNSLCKSVSYSPPLFSFLLFKGGKNFSSLTSKWWVHSTQASCRPIPAHAPRCSANQNLRSCGWPPVPSYKVKELHENRGWKKTQLHFFRGEIENPSETHFFCFRPQACEKDPSSCEILPWIHGFWVRDVFWEEDLPYVIS